MRLGGPVFDVPAGDAAAWTAAVRGQGYRAAYCPVGPEADGPTVAAFREAARRENIAIAEVGAWSNPLDPDAATASAARRKCIAALELADRIGARCAVNIAGSRGSKWDGPDARDLTSETFDVIVEVTRAIIDAVKPRTACYTLETMPWMYPDSVESYVRLLKAIDRPQAAVHFDPVNLVNSPARYYQNRALIRQFVAELGHRILSVHCKDILMRSRLTTHLDEVRPGLGGLDYAALLTELAALGDDDLPLMTEHLPREQYPPAAAFIRRQAMALGYDIADEPTVTGAPGAGERVEDGPFLHPAASLRRQDLSACHGGAGTVHARHVIEGRDGLAIPFVHDDILPPGTSIGEHRHGDDEEIYYVLEGRGTMVLDGQRRPIAAGDVAVVRPGHTHGLINDGGQPMRLLVICSRP